MKIIWFRLLAVAVFAFVFYKAFSMSEQETPKVPAEYAAEALQLRQEYFGTEKPKFPAGADTSQRRQRIEEFNAGLQAAEEGIRGMHGIFGDRPIAFHAWARHMKEHPTKSSEDEVTFFLDCLTDLRTPYEKLDRLHKAHVRDFLARIASGMQTAVNRHTEQEKRRLIVSSETDELQENCKEQIEKSAGIMRSKYGYSIDIKTLANASAELRDASRAQPDESEKQIDGGKPMKKFLQDYMLLFLSKTGAALSEDAKKVEDLEDEPLNELHGLTVNILENALDLQELKKRRR